MLLCREMLVEIIDTWLIKLGIAEWLASRLAIFASLIVLIFSAILVNFITKHFILRVVSAIVKRTRFDWDDVFLEAGVFTRLSHIAPALVVTSFGSQFFLSHDGWANTLRTSVNIYLVIIFVMVLFGMIDAFAVLFHRRSSSKGVPLNGFIQGVKLVLILMSAVLILSMMLDRSPLYFLSGLGALTAVLMLVFQNAILGLVAGIQISANRMIQIGDWIEMSKYGADGDVIDIGLTTVKVKNWDATVTTIPSYALISDPVKNWRAMHESGGRRIKRSIFIDMQSLRFVDDGLLKKMLQFRRLRPYLEQKLPELEEWNHREGEDLSVLVNGRRLTNIGCFRAYVTAYLRSHSQIHQEKTFLVRQLQPTDKGLPLEIYVFTNDTRWAIYEGVQADIFDHLLTVIPEFDLRTYQSPSSCDVREVLGSMKSG